MADDGGIADAVKDEAGGGIADEVQEGTGADEEKAEGAGGGKDAKDANEEAAEGSSKKEEAAKNADWRITAPEDFKLPDENLASFTAAAKKAGLSKEQAEAMLGWHREFHNEVTKAQSQLAANTLKGWREEIARDAEFGGANLKATVASARRALAEFDEDGAVRKLLRDTGQQENPAVIRLVARVGRAMGEHKFVGGRGGGKKTPLAERMYPKMATRED